MSQTSSYIAADGNTHQSNVNAKRDKFYVKGTRAQRKPGKPRNKPGKDIEGLYTYPGIGSYPTADDARRACDELTAIFPGWTFFVETIPANFDGVSIPGL